MTDPCEFVENTLKSPETKRKNIFFAIKSRYDNHYALGELVDEFQWLTDVKMNFIKYSYDNNDKISSVVIRDLTEAYFNPSIKKLRKAKEEKESRM